MAFYDFPAKHWRSTGTTNPIESAFGTIRCRTGKNKGCLSSQGMLHMIFKLGMRAENNWRKLNGSDFPGKVITGVKFKNGIEVKSDNQTAAWSYPHTPDLTISPVLFISINRRSQ